MVWSVGFGFGLLRCDAADELSFVEFCLVELRCVLADKLG